MISNKEIAKIRRSYSEKELNKSDVSKNPFSQLSIWLKEAVNSDIIEPNAMVISTVDENNLPASRVVLLKGIENSGLTFYTNYNSKKSKDLMQNKNSAILFFWRELGRQIRITGEVKKISKEESETYFNSRPYESKIAAIASYQSKEIPDRNFLIKKFEEIKNEFEGKEIPLPDFWGGFRLFPNYFEFWQGRENRLHDRIAYKKMEGEWQIVRLSP